MCFPYLIGQVAALRLVVLPFLWLSLWPYGSMGKLFRGLFPLSVLSRPFSGPLKESPSLGLWLPEHHHLAGRRLGWGYG